MQRFPSTAATSFAVCWIAVGGAVAGAWGVGCGSDSGTLPQGRPFDDVAGLSGVPTMEPGNDCLTCHTATGLASVRPWTVAGTVFRTVDADSSQGQSGIQILLEDVNGKRLTLTSNAAGNFYTAEPLADLVDIEVQNASHRMSMPLSVIGGGALKQVGSCNRCHIDAAGSTGPILGQQGAPGRLFVPSP